LWLIPKPDAAPHGLDLHHQHQRVKKFQV